MRMAREPTLLLAFWAPVPLLPCSKSDMLEGIQVREMVSKASAFLKISFNWQIITLQYCDSFCHRSTSIIHRHTCVLSPRTPQPLPSPPHLSWLPQSTSFGFPASYIKLPLAIYFTYGNVYASMWFSQIIPPSPPTEFRSLFFMSVSPLLPYT